MRVKHKLNYDMRKHINHAQSKKQAEAKNKGLKKVVLVLM